MGILKSQYKDETTSIMESSKGFFRGSIYFHLHILRAEDMDAEVGRLNLPRKDG